MADRGILISGIPAAGKSSYGRYLAREHGFAHYDLECHPSGWPDPNLKPVWERSREEFVTELRRRYVDWVLDWGFPPGCLPWVRELQALGAQLVWFECDIEKARALFVQRGGRAISSFERQIADIQAAHFPKGLGASVVRTLDAEGRLRPMVEIHQEVFGAAA